MDPVSPEVYGVHDGGKPPMPTLSPPNEHPRGAPIKYRKTIHNLSPTAKGILDPETGDIDPEKMRAYIENFKTEWGPEGDPERDRQMQLAADRLRDAIRGLRTREDTQGTLSDIDSVQLRNLEALAVKAAEVQALLRKKNPEFQDAPGKIVLKPKRPAKINPRAKTEPHNIFSSWPD